MSGSLKPLEEQQKTLLEEGGVVSVSRWQAKEQTDVTTSFGCAAFQPSPQEPAGRLALHQTATTQIF